MNSEVSDLILSLKDGIRFEQDNQFLKWGHFVKPMSKKINAIKLLKRDRTSYSWGNKTILNGLELELSTTFWNFGIEKWYRRFYEIEYWAIGDTKANQELERISKHLFQLFGQATSHEIDVENKENFILWKLDTIEISLFQFEQHCCKVYFKIKKIK